MSGGRTVRAEGPLDAVGVLEWIYAARLVTCLGVYGAALVIGDIWLTGGAAGLDPEVRLVSGAGLALAGICTPLSYWHTRSRAEPPGRAFLYAQALLDVTLVTGIVHITGGSEGVFPPLLYVALVSGYALVLPLASAVVVALATGLAYLLEIAFAYPQLLDVTVLVQIAIFTVVATVSGVIAGRLREVGEELRTVEGELRRLQLGTGDILHTIEMAVLALDQEGGAAYMNAAAEELLGLTAKEWIGENLLAELDGRAPGAAEAVRETLATRGPVRSREVEIVRGEDGEHRPAAVTTALIARPGVPVTVTVALQDLRMARQLEHLRLRTSRLEAVAELSASLAHEIRNPLASIRSAVEQLAESVPAAGDEEILVSLIVRETDRLSRLLVEFNDFARVDVVERKPLEMRRLIREAVELVQQRPEAEGRARFEVRVEEGLEDLWGDPDLIHRTLVNLALNAVQVGDRNAPVTVQVVADSLRPDLVPRDVSLGAPVRIRVIDDGPGIAPEDLPRIFDPFYTRREGGSGMGLAIAHRAVQAHGGALLVSSEPGRGATFAIVLPRREWTERRSFEGGPGSAAASGEEGTLFEVEASSPEARRAPDAREVEVG